MRPAATDALVALIRAHCERLGHREGPGVNNFIPHSGRHAYGMARLLIAERFDHYLAIAPEGHVYGFFFEQLGQPVGAVHVDYPPTRVDLGIDLHALRGQSVLLIEDDVIGGRTLRLVVEALAPAGVARLALYLGHSVGIQHLSNVPAEIATTYLAERDLIETPELAADYERWLTTLVDDAARA